MKVAAYLGVKDEVDLVRGALEQLRAIGVDEVLACDLGSRDGTLQFLRERARDGELRLVEMDDQRRNDVDSWAVTNSTLLQSLDADWIVFQDADERLLPAAGSIKPVLESATADIVRIPRYNVPLTDHGVAMPNHLSPDTYAGVELVVRPVPDFRARAFRDPAVSWIRGVPAPKIAVRACRFGSMAAGAHDALSVDGGALPFQVSTDLLIAHLPFTTVRRFGAKVANIRAFFMANPATFVGEQGWHWRHWAELETSEQVQREFDRQVMDADTLHALRHEGLVMSASDWFRIAAASA